MAPDDLVTMFQERIALQRQWGHVFLLFDGNRVDSISAETRKLATQIKPDPPLDGAVVVVGVGLLQRTFVSLIISAARTLGRADTGSVFFVDEVQAAWPIRFP